VRAGSGLDLLPHPDAHPDVPSSAAAHPDADVHADGLSVQRVLLLGR